MEVRHQDLLWFEECTRSGWDVNFHCSSPYATKRTGNSNSSGSRLITRNWSVVQVLSCHSDRPTNDYCALWAFLMMSRNKLMMIKLRKTRTKSEDADHNMLKIITATTPAIQKAGKGFPNLAYTPFPVHPIRSYIYLNKEAIPLYKFKSYLLMLLRIQTDQFPFQRNYLWPSETN